MYTRCTIPALDTRIANLRRELSLLEAEQRARERQHRADVLRAMKELLQRPGFTPGELTSARPVKNAGSPGRSRRSIAIPPPGASWSGRGTEPAWIKGRDRQAFKVAG